MKSMRNLQLVLFIGVMCVVQTMAQGCPYSDPRCKCDALSLSCQDLDKIPPLNTGVSVSQINDLTFLEGNLTRISNKSLPPGLSSIYIYSHPLTDISEDAFDTSAATLSRVSITGGQFTNFPTALKKLTNLTDLWLQDILIQVWDTTSLEQLAASLRSLKLINVGLSAWPSWISHFNLLFTIDLSRNSLKVIPDDAFDFVKDKLFSLHLSEIGLTQVPQALSKLLVLDVLHLSYNNLADVSEIDTITGAPFASMLSYLYLDSVGLTRAADFSNLRSLTLLSLSNNRISDIPAGLLPKSLGTLKLAHNSLSNVPEDVASMNRLQTLYLSDNFIANIESNSLSSSLSDIFLDSNNLTIITNTTFRYLSLLRALVLSSNPISVIEPGAFSDLVSLVSLFFLNSKLTEFPLAFTVLNSLKQMHWSTIQPLSCPCPTPNDLVQWYTSRKISDHIETTCSNNQSLDSYLRGQCVNTPATNIVLATGLPS